MAQKSPQPKRIRRARRAWLGLLAALALCAASRGLVRPALAAEAHAPEFRVIVNHANTTGSASRDFLTDAFLKRVTHWEGGETIHPVDQRPNAAVRKSFCENVLKRSVAAVRNFWQQRIFSGRDVPPPELDSDEAVVAYVAEHAGAVGYVSGTAKLGETREIPVN